ncbi:hypothetical protein MNV49_002746 [Pseudohyphozyma bogoriensis]|nr:hypothetical protein MNV49_002746 [Pseudohyphozyma bogoriensis]
MTLWKRAPKDVERGDPTSAKETTGRPPYFLRLRSSTAFISFTVGLGIMTDLAGYSLIVPIVPFRLQALNYTSISSKTGWLVTAFSAGLIASAPPISYLGHKIRARRGPLIFGLVFMMGGIVLFMETSNYAAMVMIGFSVGNAIGPPVGGILAERMGYRSPFVFALCLLFVDLVLRILIVEKHVALQWIQKGVEIPGFEAPGYTPEPTSPTTSSATSIPVNVTTSAPTTTPAPEANVEGGQEDDLSDEKKESTEGTARHYAAFLDMLVNPRALASFALALFYGGVIGGTLDTGLTLWLENEYHLSSQGAGLVFLGAIVPIMFVSPVAGWASDRFGAKPIAVIGVVLSIPSYALLLIKGST